MPVDEATYCAKHPKIETALTCASCGTPICPKCMVSTPVGMKCRDCGTAKGLSLFKIRPERLFLALIVALLAGGVASLIGSMGFLVIFISIPYGYFAGGLILRVTGMKRGVKLEVVAGVGIALGAILARLLPNLLLGGIPAAGGAPSIFLMIRPIADPYFLVAAGVAACCAVSKIRYL